VNNKPTITLYIEDGGWMSDSSQARNAAEVMALFGTHVLPTPFLANTRASLVKDTIERLNPGHEVVIRRAR